MGSAVLALPAESRDEIQAYEPRNTRISTERYNPVNNYRSLQLILCFGQIRYP
jgi:hypothetical protein